MDIKGYTYGYGGKRGELRSQEAVYSREQLFLTGINWMTLAFAITQDTYHSTEIKFDFRYNIPDRELAEVIQHAHIRGVKICLKPMINCRDGIWRARIDFPDDDFSDKNHYWTMWFESYSAFMLHYAQLAEDTGCEMLCIGCELSGTERKSDYWRKLITMIRTVYHGPLVYNTNHGREKMIDWWDAVDFIGTSAYYPINRCPGDTGNHMVEEWRKVAVKLRPICEHFNKKMIFMEIGCRSALGCAAMPWDFMHKELPVSEEEQADFYDSCLQVFHEVNWFAGVFWWDWSTIIYRTKEEAAANTGFDIHLKKAEEVLKHWYRNE